MALDAGSLGNLLRKERSSPSLQELGEGFYRELKDLMEETEKKYPPYSRERENLKNLVSDLFNTREKKLVLFALSFARSEETPDIENATPEEEEFVQNLTRMLRARRRGLLSTEEERPEAVEERVRPPQVEEGKTPPDEKKQDAKKITLRILQDLPPIVGADGKTYGAFKAEDIVALPERNARLFIKQGYGEAIEVQPE